MGVCDTYIYHIYNLCEDRWTQNRMGVGKELPRVAENLPLTAWVGNTASKGRQSQRKTALLRQTQSSELSLSYEVMTLACDLNFSCPSEKSQHQMPSFYLWDPCEDYVKVGMYHYSAE